MRLLMILALSLVAVISSPAAGQDARFVTGAKSFPESVVLGEIAAQAAATGGADAVARGAIGGTRVVFEALLIGEIDCYAEYTGTLLHEILASEQLETDAELQAALASRGLRMTRRLGFNNTYGVGVLPGTAERYGLRTISDLADHPELSFGMTNEFVSRQDGWPALSAAYGLEPESVRGLEHALAYRALAAGQIDVMDVYTTDAEIAEYELVVLEDDLGHFPVYDAVLLYRAELAVRAPEVAAALERLGGSIDEPAMIEMNRRVKVGGESEAAVARSFVAGDASEAARVRRQGVTLGRLWDRTREHCTLVAVAMGLGIAVSVPLGVAAYKLPRAGWLILGAVGVAQTVPSLAVLVLMIPLLGIGAEPAIAALFIYSLLPIVRNTHAGLTEIPKGLRESAAALSLSKGRVLLAIELPLAMRSISAGIKTSLVLSIGFATLGALIGAGGYGQPILEGIRLADTALILEGAIPAAAMALAAQGAMGGIERWATPRGLRGGS